MLQLILEFQKDNYVKNKKLIRETIPIWFELIVAFTE